MRIIALVLASLFATTAALAQTIRFYHHDAQGNLIAMTDDQAQVVWRAEPAPFADYTSHPAEHPQRFLDRPQEPHGLFEIGARWYDPHFGRFLTPDPMSFTGADLANPQSLNRYAYALNNPYRFHDTSGEVPVETVLDVIDIVDSSYELWNDPSWTNGIFLVWSVGATFVPYFPGAWAGKAVKYGDDIAEAGSIAKRFDDAEDISHLTIRHQVDGKSVAQQVGRENRTDWLEVYEFDRNQPRHIRGWLKNERRMVRQGRPGPRTPRGYEQAHGRATRASEGFDYSNSQLQLGELNELEELVRRKYRRR